MMIKEANVDLGSVTQTPTYAYDAVWAAALALNASIADIAPETLAQFEYATGANMTEVFRKNLYNVNFLGVSVSSARFFFTFVNSALDDTLR